MTDREMLELAAKAAGHKVTASSGCGLNHLLVRIDSAPAIWWNPLEDDGDALRLAVSLSINISFGANYVIANYVQTPTVNNANDQNAATRRAIVRAAAEIGRAM